MSTGIFSVGTLLRLGRVSNLPTVWTNAIAGGVLAGGAQPGPIIAAALSLSLFYIGGMWLNDAFDAEIDSLERANRPIPQGEISRSAVFAGGFALLAGGLAVTFLSGPTAGVVGLTLAGAILLYDWLHKRTVLAPVIMGATRFLCYALASVAAMDIFAGAALVGALGLFAYVVGLTYAAKQEAYNRLNRAWPLLVLALPVAITGWEAFTHYAAIPFWIALVAVMLSALRLLFRRSPGDVPRAVVTLIAGISLYDAALMAAAGEFVASGLAVAAFLLTVLLQRAVVGTEHVSQRQLLEIGGLDCTFR